MTKMQLLVKQMSPKHYTKPHQTLQSTKVNHNCNPFKSSSSLSIGASFESTVLIIPFFHVLSSSFCFPQFGGSDHRLNFDKFRDTTPLSCTTLLTGIVWDYLKILGLAMKEQKLTTFCPSLKHTRKWYSLKNNICCTLLRQF